MQNNKLRQEIFRHRAVVKGTYLTIDQGTRIDVGLPSRNERAGISDIEQSQQIGREGTGFSNDMGPKAPVDKTFADYFLPHKGTKALRIQKKEFESHPVIFVPLWLREIIHTKANWNFQRLRRASTRAATAAVARMTVEGSGTFVT